MSFESINNMAPANRLICGVWGLPKTGKTQLALTFPDPIYFFNFDWGLEHHINRLKADGRIVHVANYQTVGPNSAAENERLLREFERDYEQALKMGNGTIVIDTATQLWQITSKRFLDDIKKRRKDEKVYPFDYADANAYYQQLINQVKSSEQSLVLVQRAKEKYNASGQPTGIHEAQGNNAVPYLAQMLLHMEHKDGQHVATIEACWDTSVLEGTQVEDPSYKKLKDLIEQFA